MDKQHQRKIDWSTSFKKFATEAWSVGIYLALLAAAAVLAVVFGGNYPVIVAGLAVF